MRILPVICFSLLSVSSFAEPIITDIEKVRAAYEKLRNNPYYLKIGPAKFKIDYFYIGHAQTPFYENASTVKEFYRNESKCFELTIFETINIAKRVSCHNKMQELFLPGLEDFKVVSPKELVSEGLKGFKANEFSKSFELEAYVQSYDIDALDRAIDAPRRKFKAHLKGLNEIVFSNEGKEIEFHQELELSVDKIGILSPTTTVSKNSIKVNPGGHLFSNQQGKVLIYNPVLPRPFGDYELALNPNLLANLEFLAKESEKAPVCFRDNYVNPGPKDCHQLILKAHALSWMNKIKILSIDFVAQKIEFLK